MSNYPLYNTPATVNQTQLIGVGTLDFWDIENQDFKALTVDDNTLLLDGVPVGGGNIRVEEVDGVPSHPVHTIVFPNGTVGIQGTTATITLAGSGDMVLASAQTVSGAKTFLDSTLLLRNAANTFSAQFTNTITAARTYTLPNATGTVALTSDITGTNSGTNTGDQTITLTGAVTGSGTGTFTASLGSFTRSQLDTAVSDANVMYVGDAPTAHNQAWSTITSTPTTLSGYGITDAANITHVHAASDITSGTVDPARLGSGSSITTKFLRGDSTWQTISGGGDALVASNLDQFADVTQTAGQTLAITSSTTLSGGTHSGTNTGDNATNSQYSGLVSNATHTGDVTGSTALTIALGVVTPAMQTTASRTFTICGFGIDGGGVALTTQTLAAEYTVPVAMTLTGYNAACDTGTFTVKFWKIATGTALPTSANSINTSGVGISTGTALRSSTLTDFTTTAFAAGDIVRCAITAVSGATFLKVALEGTKD